MVDRLYGQDALRERAVLVKSGSCDVNSDLVQREKLVRSMVSRTGRNESSGRSSAGRFPLALSGVLQFDGLLFSQAWLKALGLRREVCCFAWAETRKSRAKCARRSFRFDLERMKKRLAERAETSLRPGSHSFQAY